MRELGRHGRHRLFRSLIGTLTPVGQATRGNAPACVSSLARHPSPAMGFVPADLRAYGYYAVFVRSGHECRPFGRLVVMPFYLPQVGGLTEARKVVQVASVGPQIPVVAEAPQVAVEFRVIDRVK